MGSRWEPLESPRQDCREFIWARACANGPPPSLIKYCRDTCRTSRGVHVADTAHVRYVLRAPCNRHRRIVAKFRCPHHSATSAARLSHVSRRLIHHLYVAIAVARIRAALHFSNGEFDVGVREGTRCHKRQRSEWAVSRHRHVHNAFDIAGALLGAARNAAKNHARHVQEVGGHKLCRPAAHREAHTRTRHSPPAQKVC